MYLHTPDKITLFHLPNTLAGDAGLTLIIQPIVTWLIEALLVNLDLRTSSVSPLAYPLSPSSPVRKFLGVPSSSPTNPESQEQPSSSNRRMGLVGQILRLFFCFILPSFLILWPISVGILTAVGEKQGSDYVFQNQWAPQIFKLVLGAVQGLLITPVMAAFWVMREGLLMTEGGLEG